MLMFRDELVVGLVLDPEVVEALDGFLPEFDRLHEWRYDPGVFYLGQHDRGSSDLPGCLPPARGSR